MFESNIKKYLKITHIFSSAMWHLPRQIFDLAIESLNKIQFSLVQFSRSVMSYSLRPHGLQRARPPHPSPTAGLLPKLMFVESVIPSNHLILCCPLLLLSSIFPSIRVFSNESALRMRWPKYWSFNISPSIEHPGLIYFRMDWLDLLAVQGLSRDFSNTTVQKDQFFSAQLSL